MQLVEYSIPRGLGSKDLIRLGLSGLYHQGLPKLEELRHHPVGAFVDLANRIVKTEILPHATRRILPEGISDVTPERIRNGRWLYSVDVEVDDYDQLTSATLTRERNPNMGRVAGLLRRLWDDTPEGEAVAERIDFPPTQEAIVPTPLALHPLYAFTRENRIYSIMTLEDNPEEIPTSVAEANRRAA